MPALLLPALTAILPIIMSVLGFLVKKWLDKMNLDDETKRNFLSHWEQVQKMAAKITESYHKVEAAKQQANDWYAKHQKEKERAKKLPPSV